MIVKRSTKKQDLTLVNIYVPNSEALKCVKQILTEP